MTTPSNPSRAATTIPHRRGNLGPSRAGHPRPGTLRPRRPHLIPRIPPRTLRPADFATHAPLAKAGSKTAPGADLLESMNRDRDRAVTLDSTPPTHAPPHTSHLKPFKKRTRDASGSFIEEKHRHAIPPNSAHPRFLDASGPPRARTPRSGPEVDENSMCDRRFMAGAWSSWEA